jgi:hypothetical protein
VDLGGWGERLDELVRGDRVPGASLAVLADGEVTALASGVLHKGTGVEVTPVVAFARLHLDGGRAPDGGGLLAAPRIAEMQQAQVEVPNPHGVGLAGHWGLGWALFDWGGRRVYGHDGSTIGQSAYLRVVPDAGVVVALLTNSDGDVSRAFAEAVLTELLGELSGLAVPPAPQPPADPPRVDLGRFTGVYERVGIRLEITTHEGRLRMHAEETGELADPAFEMDLIPLDGAVVLGRPPGASQWMPILRYSLADGAQYLHAWARATPKVR